MEPSPLAILPMAMLVLAKNIAKNIPKKNSRFVMIPIIFFFLNSVENSARSTLISEPNAMGTIGAVRIISAYDSIIPADISARRI